MRLVSNFGVDINRTDAFDASPLMLVCMVYKNANIRRVCVVMLKWCNIYLTRAQYWIATRSRASGIASQYLAKCRCLYGALNDTIRLMLLKFDVSKTVDPTQPFASFLISLLNSVDMPSTADVVFHIDTSEPNQKSTFPLHRFVLAARSEDFRRNLETQWKGKPSVRFASFVQSRSIESVVKYLYSGEATDPGKEFRDNLRLVAETLHLPSDLIELVEATGLPPTAAIRDLKRTGMNRVQSDFEKFVQDEILSREKTVVTKELKEACEEMSVANPSWADCLLYVDRQDCTTTLYYAHLAILTRSEYFLTMFTSPFSESRTLFETHDTLPLLELAIDVDVAPIVLLFLYTDRAEIQRDIALEVLYAADFLLLPRLKSLAAIALENDVDPLNELSKEDLYEIIRAAWSTNTPRLECFSCTCNTNVDNFVRRT